jgi:hypothetical protein
MPGLAATGPGRQHWRRSRVPRRAAPGRAGPGRAAPPADPAALPSGAGQAHRAAAALRPGHRRDARPGQRHLVRGAWLPPAFVPDAAPPAPAFPAPDPCHALALAHRYANGVALSADKSFVAVVETSRARVLRHRLAGPKVRGWRGAGLPA